MYIDIRLPEESEKKIKQFIQEGFEQWVKESLTPEAFPRMFKRKYKSIYKQCNAR